MNWVEAFSAVIDVSPVRNGWWDMRDLDAGALNAVVRTVFALPGDAESVVAARLKHMQRLRFPSADGVGQGFRRTYGVGDVLKVCVAFQLVDAGLPSALAVRLVGWHWNVVSAELARAINGGPAGVALTPGVIVELSPTAAKSWRGGVCADAKGRRSKDAPTAAKRPMAAGGGTVPPPSPIIRIGLTDLVRSVKRALGQLKGIASDEIDGALEVFARTSGASGEG